MIKSNRGFPRVGPGGSAGGAGTSGFALGPANNIFGAAGSSGTDLTAITIAGSRDIAEATRDAYDTANTGWIAGYTDLPVSIILYYESGGNEFVQYQRHVVTSWVDNGPAVVAIKGDKGDDGTDGAATDFSGVGGPGHIPAIGAGPGFTPADSGLRAVNEILYFGEIDTNLTMRIRRDNTSGFLFFERYNGTTSSWDEIFQISQSAAVDIVFFLESNPPTSVPANGLALYNRRIRDNNGTEILRPFFTDGTNTFPAIASLPNGNVRVIQNLAEILADPDNTNASYKTIAFSDDLASVATSGSYNDLSNKPTIGVTVENEGTPLANLGTILNFVGDGVTVSGTGTRKVITIPGGGTPTPTPGPDDFRYGLSQESDPASVTWGDLTDVADPTDPQTVDTGTTSAGDYFHIFSASTHDIQTIRDTVLDQIVYQDGGTGNIFTKQAGVRTESGVIYDSYSIGPLNAGIDEEYVVRFS